MEAKKGSNAIVIGLGAVLLLYTGYRTFELMSMTLPSGSEWVGLLSLVALDLGVVLWAAYHTHQAQSAVQSWIAVGMVTLCLAGVGLAVTGDTIFQASKKDFASAKTDIAFWAIVAQSIIVFANVVAATVVHMISPDAAQLKRERRHQYNIKEEQLKAVGEKSQILAREAAQIYAEYWIEQERAKYRPLRLTEASQPLQQLQAPQPQQQVVQAPIQPQPTPVTPPQEPYNPAKTFIMNSEVMQDIYQSIPIDEGAATGETVKRSSPEIVTPAADSSVENSGDTGNFTKGRKL